MTLSVPVVIFLLIAAPTTPSRNETQLQDPVDKGFTCGTILVNCPETNSGRSITFKATFSQGVPATKVNYKWTVTGGKITQGQGTEEITVKSKRKSGQRVTATVEVLGIPKDCSNKASCSTDIH